MIGQPLSTLKRSDVELWSTKVGRMHSRNNIIVRGDIAFLSSSGELWNVPDDRDGVYCIDLASQSIIWFAKTFSDANEVSLIGDTLLVGTDHGRVFALNAKTGAIVEEIKVEGPVYTRAIELEVLSGRIALLISRSGQVIQFHLETNKFSILGAIPHSVRANLTKITSASFLVGSEEGVVLLVELIDGHVHSRPVFEVTSHRASGSFDFNLNILGISSIVRSGDRIVISYIRNTYDRRPPMVCFSLETGKKLWDAGRVKDVSKAEKTEFGNSRVQPAIWNGQLISTFSYNDAVHSFSLETGKWIWRQRLDNSYFQNWSSPIVSEGFLYVARINGVLSIVDLKTRKMISSYSVELFDVLDGSEASRLKYGREPWPNNKVDFESGPYPGQEIIAGICSTPAIWNDMILVGTVSGKLSCLRTQQTSKQVVGDWVR